MGETAPLLTTLMDGAGELAMPLALLRWTALVAQTDQLNYHPGPQPDICPMENLLELVKGLVLWNDTSRISMTGGSQGTSERSSGEDPVMTV